MKKNKIMQRNRLLASRRYLIARGNKLDNTFSGQACRHIVFQITPWLQISASQSILLIIKGKTVHINKDRKVPISKLSHVLIRGQAIASNKGFHTPKHKSSRLCKVARKYCQQRRLKVTAAIDLKVRGEITAWIQASEYIKHHISQRLENLRILRTQLRTMMTS